jgi:hypothetical protein
VFRARSGLKNFKGGSTPALASPHRRKHVPEPGAGAEDAADRTIDDAQHVDTRTESASDRLLRDERAARCAAGACRRSSARR